MKGEALLKIKKLIDRGIVRLASESPKVELLPTGIASLDELLGGGIPAGQLTEIYGPYGTGKSTIIYHVLAANSAMKRVDIGLSKEVNAAFVDTEASFTKERASVVGVRAKRLALITPDYGEQALDLLFALIEAGIKMVAIDSLRGLVPAKILEGEISDDTVAMQARLFAKFFPRYVLLRKRPALVCVNQITSRIGVPSWADPYTTPGGHAIKHLAYLRLEVKRRKTMKVKDKPVGQEVAIKITKSKYCSPMRDTTMFLIYDRGYVDGNEWEKERKARKADVVEE